MTVVVYKPVSKTPLEMVMAYKNEHPEGVRIGYAGRLDPMAEGLLLLLIGEENKDRKQYEMLDKEYEFEVLFGISTDSHDLMGMITEEEVKIETEGFKWRAEKELASLVGTWEQDYPPYSSAVVLGKPLYWWTRQGRLGEITIPKKEITVKALEVLEWRDVPLGRDVAQTAIDRIQKVDGDFRQEEIISQWKKVAAGQTHVQLPLATCRVVCSSGTYVRGLAHTLGRALKIPALAYSIKRTRIGAYDEVASTDRSALEANE